MSRLLIGSSNVYRTYKPPAFKRFPEYAMIRCVEFEILSAQLTNLDPEEKEVTISVLENFMVKAAGNLEGKEREVAVVKMVEGYVEEIAEAVRQNKQTKFVLIDPILRPKYKWYDALLDDVRKRHKECIQAADLPNIFPVDVISQTSQQFEQDGIHLTPAAGKVFVEAILDASEKIFRSKIVDLESDETITEDSPELVLANRLGKLENEVEERRWNDNLIFARTREELDTIANKAKEDRVVITGLTSTTLPPSDWSQRKVWLRKVVIDVLKKVYPQFSGNLGFINQGKNNGKDIPMVEAKCESVEVAIAIRKSVAEKRKADVKTFGRLYIANSVSLSTRVRVDIMKAIAKKLTNKEVNAHVAAYSSRPILHVRDVGKPEAAGRAYTFIDSVTQFGGSVIQDDLHEAYRRAGSAFKGQMEQHFVVLKENFYHQGPAPDSRVKSGNRGGKRSREDDEDAGPSSKNSKAPKSNSKLKK
jgi:hypothetical protein